MYSDVIYAKRWFYASLAILLFTLSCASKKTTESEVKLEAPPNLEDPKLARQAAEFDRYLANKLKNEEIAIIKSNCEQRPGDNLFCTSVLQRETYEQDSRLSAAKAPGFHRSAKMVRAKFLKTRLLNWQELRFATVPSLIRGLSIASNPEIEQLKKRVLLEENCPNNAALAMGAFLEDRLPDRTTFREIAELYEKSTQCPQPNPNDREAFLTRAALFYFAQKDFTKAEALLKNATSSETAFKARSLYWLYRTEIELSKKEASLAALTELTQTYPFSFHAIVALTANQKDPGEILLQTKFNHQTRSGKNRVINALLEQVEVLHRYGFKQSASKVLSWAIAGAQSGIEPELLVYMSDLRGEEGDYQAGISILSDVLYDNPELVSRSTMERYFPRPYFPIFEKYSHGIDPYLLLSIARRESAFNSRAISSANAQGLLQLTPKTLRALKLKKDLMDPESNVIAGSKYVAELLTRMNGQVHLALAAYNAGPHRLVLWTARYPIQEPILFIDLIPFKETREYVAAVLRNYYWYRRIHENTNHLEVIDYKLTQPN